MHNAKLFVRGFSIFLVHFGNRRVRGKVLIFEDFYLQVTEKKVNNISSSKQYFNRILRISDNKCSKIYLYRIFKR